MRKNRARDLKITKEFLDFRSAKSIESGFEKQKWIIFCEWLLKQGFDASLYEAKKTVSKYITIYHKNSTFKVRYSNHRPIKDREIANDCDFFVGVTNLKITRTSDAMLAVTEWKKKL